MIHRPKLPALSRRARWAVPAGVLVVTAAVGAGSAVSIAQAAPVLPSRTPAQLLDTAMTSAMPPLTGTVVETASLGLPSLPGESTAGSVASLLTGSHTIRVWYLSQQRFRLSVPETLSETDLFRDGNTAWLWNSGADTVTKYLLPASKPVADTAPLTPQQAADQALARVGKTTVVSTESNVSVAGVPAYQLVLAPKSDQSLIGRITIAVDAANGVPLRVQVFARGAASPAFQVGYTSIQFVAPAPAEVSFTPPPGATVLNSAQGLARQGSVAGQLQQGEAGGKTIGSGWMEVLEVPGTAMQVTVPGPQQAPVKPVPARQVRAGVEARGGLGQVLAGLEAATVPVHGAWGSGRLLRTSLLSVLITSNGAMYIGAVRPAVLYADATSG